MFPGCGVCLLEAERVGRWTGVLVAGRCECGMRTPQSSFRERCKWKMFCPSHHDKKMKTVNTVQQYIPPYGGSTLALLAPIPVPLPRAREPRPLFHSSGCSFLCLGCPPPPPASPGIIPGACTAKPRRPAAGFLPGAGPSARMQSHPQASRIPPHPLVVYLSTRPGLPPREQEIGPVCPQENSSRTQEGDKGASNKFMKSVDSGYSQTRKET